MFVTSVIVRMRASGIELLGRLRLNRVPSRPYRTAEPPARLTNVLTLMLVSVRGPTVSGGNVSAATLPR
jgi:hypothetical protein